MGILDTDKIDKIKKLMVWHPKGMTISDISSELGMNRNLTSKYLDLLVISGHVDVQRMGTAKVYTVSHRVPIAEMLEHSSDLVIVIDREKKILLVNNNVLERLGNSRTYFIGKTVGKTGNDFLDSMRIANPAKEDTGSIADIDFPCTLRDKEHWFRLKQVPTAFEDGTKGVTLICVDISASRQIVVNNNRHIRDLEFLAEKAREFVELAPEADIYVKIAADLKSIIPDAKIAVSSYDNTSRIVTLRSWVFGMGGRSLFKKYVGRDPVGLEIPISHEAHSGMQTGRLLRLNLSFYQMLFEGVPEEACKTLEDEYNLHDTYGIGFTREGFVFGDAAIFLPDGKKIPNQHLVEAYSGAAAIALQNHILESVIRQNGFSK